MRESEDSQISSKAPDFEIAYVDSAQENLFPLQKRLLDHEGLIKILDTMQAGFENKKASQIEELFTDDGMWAYHPHNPARAYCGKNEIREMLEQEFSGKLGYAMQYFPETILYDSSEGSAYVEWIIKSKEIRKGAPIIRQHSYAIRISLSGNRIFSLRSYSTKTIDAWTREITNEMFQNFQITPEEMEQIQNETTHMKPTTKEMDSYEETSGSHSTSKSTSKSATRTGEGPSFRRSKNGGRRYAGGSRRNGGRNGRQNYGRNGGRAYGRNGGRAYGKNNNRRYNRRRNNNGRANDLKKIYLPWICSDCQTNNTSDARTCVQCNKKFQFARDLTEEQKQQLKKRQTKRERNSTQMNGESKPSQSPREERRYRSSGSHSSASM